MAALVGAVLKADYSFCFSAFFSLNIVNQKIWYLLKSNEDKKYYELAQFIKEAEDTCFFYIYPALSNDPINNDNLQCKIVKNLTNVYSFPVKTNQHGVCISIDSLDTFINSSKGKLISLHSKIALQESIPVNFFEGHLLRIDVLFKIKLKRIFNLLKSIIHKFI